MEKKTKIAVAVSTVAVLMAGAGYSIAETRGGDRPDFATLDADGNGEVTVAEMQAYAQSRFVLADTDGDAALSRDELIARFGERMAEKAERRVDFMIERFDANGDGALSQEEFPDRSERMTERFLKLDADQSGGVSEEEFANAKSMFKERRGGMKNKNQDDS